MSTSRDIKLAAVAREPFILFPGRPRPSFADQMLSFFRAEQLLLRVVLEANDLQTALGLVAAGIGVTLVPASVTGLRRDDVAFLSLAAPGASSPLFLSYRDGDRSPLLRGFLGFVRPG